MSEEIAIAAADLATVASLRTELAAAQSVIGGLRRSLAAVQQERDTLYAELDRWRAASAELTAAQARERVATEAYNQQQSSYRELEALYQAMTERAVKAETERRAWVEIGARAEADAEALREALQGYKRVAKYIYTQPGEGTTLVSEVEIQADRALAGEHPGAALLTELEAARAVVEAARQFDTSRDDGPDELGDALAKYDAAKASAGDG